MPTITLKEGDFGADLPITLGAEDLYLPDPDRPGLKIALPLAEVAEMESIADDRSAAIKTAAKLGIQGLLSAGPAGLAASMFAATKIKDVQFTVALKDGRRFVAVTDARTYADLHAAQIAARDSANGEAPSSADAIIAKYLDEMRAPAAADPPAAMAPDPQPVPEPPALVERRATERPASPTFGRRRSAG